MVLDVSGALSGAFSKSKTREHSLTKNFSDKVQKALEEQALDNIGVYGSLINNDNPKATDALNSLFDMGQKGLDVDSIMAAAKQQSDEALGQSYQDLARSVGAVDNSLVQQAYDKAATNAATQLAGTRAQLEASGSQQQVDAIQTALNALHNKETRSAQVLNALLNTLKGGQADTKGTSSTSSQQYAGDFAAGISL